jgi:hypothetical protein
MEIANNYTLLTLADTSFTLVTVYTASMQRSYTIQLAYTIR